MYEILIGCGQAILIGCAILNLCGSIFIIVSFYILSDIRQSARGLWHLLIKSVAVLPLTGSYIMLSIARDSTFWCNTQFVLQTISAPVFLVAELCISLEILFAVRSALTQSHISSGVGLIRGIYVLAMVWGMISVVAGFTFAGPISFVSAGHASDLASVGFCYYKSFAPKLAFYYSVVLLSIFVSLCVLTYLMYLQYSLRLAKLSEVTSLLLTILVVFIATWTPPLMVRLGQNFNNRVLIENEGLQLTFLVTISGSGFLDCLLWIHFRPVRRALLVLCCGASAEEVLEEEGEEGNNSSLSLWERPTRSTFGSSKRSSTSKLGNSEEVVAGFPSDTSNPLL